jgi:5-methylcytosine-specific restriction protein B
MAIPKDLTREHVLQAIADLDRGITIRWSRSRKYDLVYNGKHYAPKAVLGHAICIAKQCDPYSLNFDGGDPTNLTLQELGFEIISKNQYAER